ncbi:MAG TPA: glutamate--tRNA ligase [Candidatus Paceibacterota bacterium]|nr:glutamate--tRNA ligase [Candidatus Paceibacterota bacterium]
MMTNKLQINNPRVRFAPSPTGYFHIGSARTALFNWLVAKKYGGQFILRIEDTDVERSKSEFEKDIIDGLKWLGLFWNEGLEMGGQHGPYRQSENLNIYEKYLHQVVDAGQAYYCFCSEEELEAKRQDALSRGEMFRYDGHCRSLSSEEVQKKLKNKEPFVIRFKMPEKKFVFNDLIRGKVEFDGSLIGDQVIAKNFRLPLYNFTVVIDDHNMQITHVIRGEDHISNTPKQIALYEALGWPFPIFGHLPLILDENRAKLSKRFGAVAVNEYRRNGYLAEALINFLIFLGWHPEEKTGEGAKEVLTKEELIRQFSLERVQKAGAVFNVEKLDWLNGEHIKKMSLDDFLEQAVSFLIPVFGEKVADNIDYLKKVLALHQERVKKLSDLAGLVGYFFALPDYPGELLSWREMTKADLAINIDLLINLFSNLEEANFTKKQLEVIVMPEAEKRGRGQLLWPLRVALSGAKNSAGPFEIMEIIGKSETLKRLEIAKKKLSNG